ncbi:hypothetical protein D3C73_1032830 [compost metagenome]
MDCSQRGGGEETQHSASFAQAVEAIRNGGQATNDMGQARPCQGHDHETDTHAVIPTAILWLAEKTESTDEQHEGQDQGHPPEGPIDHAVNHVREPPGQTPPGEGGDRDAQHQIEQGCTVPAVGGIQITDVVADSPDPGADNVADALPET